MVKYRNSTKVVMLISAIMCIVALCTFTIMSVDAQVVTTNAYNIDYNGSNNKVHCGIEIQGVAIDTTVSPIKVECNKSTPISVALKKYSQKVNFPVGVRLTGTVALHYDDSNMTRLWTAEVDHTFDCLNKDYSEVLFSEVDFSKGNGEYIIRINLKYTQGTWSTNYDDLFKFEYVKLA